MRLICKRKSATKTEPTRKNLVIGIAVLFLLSTMLMLGSCGSSKKASSAIVNSVESTQNTVTNEIDPAEDKAKAEAEQEAKAKAEQEAKAKAEQEAKAKAEQEVKAKAEQEAKAKAEQEAKAKAEQEAKAKAEQEAKAKAEQEKKDTKNASYIGNANSKIFHYPGCASVQKMSQSNMVFFYGDRSEPIGAGYRACKNCKP